MTTMTHLAQSTPASPSLLLAFELSASAWKLGFTVGLGQAPRVRTITAGALERVWTEIAAAKQRFGLGPDAPVASCYEAGRDGFWLHRALQAHGVTNVVVDSSSIEVNRRARRIKTDGLDLLALVALLARYARGEDRVWRVVRVPTEAEEDARQRHRLRETLQQERTRMGNRLRSLLATQGVHVAIRGDFEARLAAVRRWDGSALPPGFCARVQQVWAQWHAATTQLATVDAAIKALPADTPAAACATRLQTLRGLGQVGSWVLATEIFAWRQIRNGRELGALVGLVPAAYQSGGTAHDQGITRAGNRHVRSVVVELAWSWLRYQPTSALSRWYHARFSQSRRLRRIGIVALARKLLVAWWRYWDAGVIPEGAVLKPTVA